MGLVWMGIACGIGEFPIPCLSLLLRGIALLTGVLRYLPVQCCAIWCIGAVSSALLRRDETGDTFATSCEGCVETGVAFARAGRASTETVIAFAREKWVV